MAGATKTEFLQKVIAASPPTYDAEVLMTYDTFVRDNIRIAAEALQLRLIRLVADPDGLGYQLRITPGGRRLVAGDLAGAAAAIDGGSVSTRILGQEPFGPIGARLTPGDPPVPLHSSLLRTNAPEVLRGIATGHLRVEDDHLWACTPRSNRGATLRGGVGTASLGERNLKVSRRGGRG